MSNDAVADAEDGADEEMADASNDPAVDSLAKRKRSTAKNTTLSQFTIRNPQWAYIHLSLIVSPTLAAAAAAAESGSSNMNDVKARSYLQYALSQFLGLHGAAISVDILKLSGPDVWVRVPREDVSAVVAAVGGWVGKDGEGWRIKGWGCWGPAVGKDGGLDLFGPG
ncbi:hypothetical protein MBLNU459_g1710t2 [Dothideomycetes sp. NU459]